MRLFRSSLARAAALAFVVVLPAACESGFLDPELAGSWGGADMEVTVEASRVTARQQCNTVSHFPGDVRLGEQREFRRDGVVRIGSESHDVVLSAWLSGPDTMMAMVYSPDPLADPAPPIMLVRGRPATWNSLVLCAQ